MNSHIKVSFWIRKARVNSESKVPIIIRITIGDERKDKHTGQSVVVKDWDASKDRAHPSNETNTTINDYLDQLYYKVIKLYNRLAGDYDHVTLDDLMDVYENKSASSHKLIELVMLHNKDFLSRTKVDKSISTYEKYRFTDEKLRDFLWRQYNVQDIHLSKLSIQFVKDFHTHLLKVTGNSHNTIAKDIKNLKRIINYGIEIEWLKSNPFTAYRIGYKQTEQVILSPDELASICKTEFKTPRLQLAKNLFVFQCYTGLSYVDIKQLTAANISHGPDGSEWIYISRSKTGTRAAIPLLSQAKEIIQLYNKAEVLDRDKKLFPAYCIHIMNEYLKEIASVNSINKKLTTHVGRRTFATTVLLNNGTPIEVISKVLGHLNISTTQIYAKVSDFMVKKEMDKVSRKLSGKNDRLSLDE